MTKVSDRESGEHRKNCDSGSSTGWNRRRVPARRKRTSEVGSNWERLLQLHDGARGVGLENDGCNTVGNDLRICETSINLESTEAGFA